MKKAKNIINRLLFVAALAITFQAAQAQEDKKDKIRDLIESQQYVFTAQSMIPTRGGLRYLTSGYDLAVSKDTVEAFLPYFGRAYMAPVDPLGGPLKFTSTDFKYEISKGKKGSWEIIIKPKDIRYGEQLYLRVFENGSATLRVVSNNRDPISFNGYISKTS